MQFPPAILREESKSVKFGRISSRAVPETMSHRGCGFNVGGQDSAAHYGLSDLRDRNKICTCFLPWSLVFDLLSHVTSGNHELNAAPFVGLHARCQSYLHGE